VLPMAKPDVSVLIVVRDGEAYLAPAIESALAQQHAPLEVLVVDDGSSDATVAVAQRFGPPVRCISQGRRGIGAARNLAVRASRGEYLAFLDADDVWTPHKTSCQLEAFAADASLDIVLGQHREFISADLDPATARRLACRSDWEPGYHAGAALMRRSLFERIGLFREDLTTGEYLDWIARAHEHGVREKLLDDRVVMRRIHGSNHGLIHAYARTDYARLLKSALDRRRAAADPAQQQPRNS
jgi:glycosyltransferase involved in cell wall biosynthesis